MMARPRVLLSANLNRGGFEAVSNRQLFLRPSGHNQVRARKRPIASGSRSAETQTNLTLI